MALFGPPKNEDYPRKWKEMSFDFRLMFVYHGCMMALFVTGGMFTTKQELLIAAVLVPVLTLLSLRHRNSIGWRWQGIETKDLAMAIGVAALMVFFLRAGSSLFPASDPRFLPWYLAGFGIGFFNVLSTLKVVRSSESQMLADSRTNRAEQPSNSAAEPLEPGWHRIVRGIYTCLFLLVWIEGVYFFQYFGKTFQSGSQSPTVTQTEPISDHGKVVYVTPAQKAQLDRVEMMMFTGIPTVLVGGFALHFLVGVKLWPNTQTLAEWRLGRRMSEF